MVKLHKIKVLTLTIVAGLFFTTSCLPPDHLVYIERTKTYSNKIRIASFNIQVFGQSKSTNEEVLPVLGQIIREFDIIAIQEIRDIEGTAIGRLLDEVNAYGDSYEYIVGPRVGATDMKEQYAFMYNSATIENLSQEYTYNDTGSDFSRPPFAGYFKAANGTFKFVLVAYHAVASDTDTTTEINSFPNVITDVPSNITESDIISLGDFNADGTYYDESNLQGVFSALANIDDGDNILIENPEDTTVSATDYTYDRMIITNSAMEDYSGEKGVFRFDVVYSLTTNPSALDVSDHYPVWAEFNISSDSD